MCIRCGPPERQYCASGHVPSLAAAVAFRHWQAEQLADCALSLVTAGARSPSPSGTAQNITQLAALLANELEASVSPDTPLLLAGHSMRRRWRLNLPTSGATGLRHKD
ncbi:MAG: thioesterase domain-containing protein [Escherichia coli]